MEKSQPSNPAPSREVWNPRSRVLVLAAVALLLFAVIIGARHALKRVGGPSVGVQRLAKQIPAPETDPQAESDSDDPVPPLAPKAGETPPVLPDGQKQAAIPAPATQPEGRGLSISISLGSDGSGNFHFGFAPEDMVTLLSDDLKLSESQKARVAAWAEWKSKAVEALSEPERADANRIKQIDDAYREGVKSELDQTQAALLQKAWSRPPLQWGSEPAPK